MMTEMNLELEAEVLRVLGSAEGMAAPIPSSPPAQEPPPKVEPPAMESMGTDGAVPTGLSPEEEEEILLHAIRLSSESFVLSQIHRYAVSTRNAPPPRSPCF